MEPSNQNLNPPVEKTPLESESVGKLARMVLGPLGVTVSAFLLGYIFLVIDGIISGTGLSWGAGYAMILILLLLPFVFVVSFISLLPMKSRRRYVRTLWILIALCALAYVATGVGEIWWRATHKI